jgi:hypothetical protein
LSQNQIQFRSGSFVCGNESDNSDTEGVSEKVSSMSDHTTLKDILSPEHLTVLREGSGISDEAILARGYLTITDPKELRDRGFSRQQSNNVPGLLLPVHTTDGNNGLYCYRPDVPRVVEDRRKKRNLDGSYKTRIIKYEIPKDESVRLDCPPACRPMLADPSKRLWLTEGQKKADCLASRGLCTIHSGYS